MTETKQQTLAEWLLEQIAADEAEARSADYRPHSGTCFVVYNDCAGTLDCDCGMDARVLAECEAKRRIVERWEKRQSELAANEDATRELCADIHASERDGKWTAHGHPSSRGSAIDRERDYLSAAIADLHQILAALALPYADRPGYREEWRP